MVLDLGRSVCVVWNMGRELFSELSQVNVRCWCRRFFVQWSADRLPIRYLLVQVAVGRAIHNWAINIVHTRFENASFCSSVHPKEEFAYLFFHGHPELNSPIHSTWSYQGSI